MFPLGNKDVSMPLKTGKNSMGSNISELIDTFQRKGKIGNSTPKTKDQARRQAIAISYRLAGKK